MQKWLVEEHKSSDRSWTRKLYVDERKLLVEERKSIVVIVVAVLLLLLLIDPLL